MKKKLSLCMTAAFVALAGCGGGGGGTTGGSATPPPAPAPDPTALQTTVPAPSYAASSIVLSAYTTLNNARNVIGVGLLAESSLLDTAARNHASYIDLRYQAGDYTAATHTEAATAAGYTGTTPADRIAFAKYAASSSGEVLSSIIAVDGVVSDPGVVAVESLLSGPYHRFTMFDGYRDIGFGDTAIRLPGEGGMRHTVVADFGVQQGSQQQAPAASWIGAWPADKAMNVLYSFAGEAPNPIPANNGACAGYPVSLQVKAGQTLTTTAFTLTEASTGAQVAVQLSTAANDANPSFARASAAYIIPFKPLKLGTQYTAHFVGARDGSAVDKTWSFTTRSDNVKAIYGCDPS